MSRPVRIVTDLDRKTRALCQKHGVTFGQFMVLEALYHKGPLSVGEVKESILSTDLNGDNIVAIPLESDEKMDIGYIMTTDRPLNAITKRYLEHLNAYINNCSI